MRAGKFKTAGQAADSWKTQGRVDATAQVYRQLGDRIPFYSEDLGLYP